MGPVFKLIILSLYNTNSFKIITNRYGYFFFLYNIPNYFIVLGVIYKKTKKAIKYILKRDYKYKKL